MNNSVMITVNWAMALCLLDTQGEEGRETVSMGSESNGPSMTSTWITIIIYNWLVEGGAVLYITTNTILKLIRRSNRIKSAEKRGIQVLL